MNFQSPILEKVFKSFKWTRNNTIQLFKEAEKGDILSFQSSSTRNSSYTFQPLLFQFQCILTTTDTYYRKMTQNKNQEFGILLEQNHIVLKKDILKEATEKLLEKQLNELQGVFQRRDDDSMEFISIISNHEYLHQGQMIVMFREAGVELPERFKKAWAL